MYIGLREKRYGPEKTSAVVGRWGLRDVLAANIFLAAVSPGIRLIIIIIAPIVLALDCPRKGSGRNLCNTAAQSPNTI
jgi:hypothetical protein